jgi:hypothetical protein
MGLEIAACRAAANLVAPFRDQSERGILHLVERIRRHGTRTSDRVPAWLATKLARCAIGNSASSGPRYGSVPIMADRRSGVRSKITLARQQGHLASRAASPLGNKLRLVRKLKLMWIAKSKGARALHSVVLKGLPACSAKSFTVLLEALLNGVIAICQLRSAKPRCVARACLALLRIASSGLRACVAICQN